MSAEKKTKYAGKKIIGTCTKSAHNNTAVRSSINGYKKEIEDEQWRHAPRKTNQERTGILSYHARACLQCVQCEPGVTILCCRIKR